MSGYTPPSGADDPVLVVRTIGRLAQMVIELRDEYVNSRRADTLDQIERRLDELSHLHRQLADIRHAHASADADAPTEH